MQHHDPCIWLNEYAVGTCASNSVQSEITKYVRKLVTPQSLNKIFNLQKKAIRSIGVGRAVKNHLDYFLWNYSTEVMIIKDSIAFQVHHLLIQTNRSHFIRFFMWNWNIYSYVYYYIEKKNFDSISFRAQWRLILPLSLYCEENFDIFSSLNFMYLQFFSSFIKILPLSTRNHIQKSCSYQYET